MPEIYGCAMKRGPVITHAQPTYVDFRWWTRKYTRSALVVDGNRYEVEGGDNRVRVGGLSGGTSYNYTMEILGATRFSGSFRTPPASGVVKFAVIGDSGCGSTEQILVREQIKALDPDVLLHTGDVIYPSGFTPETRYDPYYFQPYGEIVSKVPWYHTMSAHDVEAGTGGGNLHFKYFDKPDRPLLYDGFPANRSFNVRIANVEIFFLSVPDGYGTYRWLDLDWFDEASAASTADWKLVVTATPIYSTGVNWTSDTALRAMLEPIYLANEIDMSFSGHMHSYQRTTAVYDGVAGSGPMHVVTGGGGQSLYNNGVAQAWTASQLKDWHVVYFEIDGTGMTGYCYDKSGVQQDTWSLST